MQEDWLLVTDIGTVLTVPMTSNTAVEAFPGNVLVPVESAGLDKDSVAVVTQLGPVSRECLDPYPAGPSADQDRRGRASGHGRLSGREALSRRSATRGAALLALAVGATLSALAPEVTP